MNSNGRGGSRPKRRPDDARGGTRPGAGGLVRNLHLDMETARELRILTFNRRNVTGRQSIQVVDTVTELIHAAWLEYDAMIQRMADEAIESGVQP